MREIKFRAWDGKHMVLDVGTLPLGGDERFSVSSGTWKFRPNEAELMQYTGLKDRNGVEIYEGDIVKVNDDWGDPSTHQVKWDGDYPAFELYPGFDLEANNLMSALAGEGGMTVEVIGNIYENPQLLEEAR